MIFLKKKGKIVVMNIVYTVDDKFVPQLATGICSVCENNEKEKIHFYIISKQISESNRKKILDFVNCYDQEISIIELKDIKAYIDFDFDTSSWNDIVLARLFFDKLLPDDVDKIIYLDADTMVRGNLKELWNLNLSDYVLGAAIEPTASQSTKNNIDLKSSDYYYNAGVLYINMIKWKELNAGKMVLDYYKSHNGRLFANDQCAINGALKDYILPVSITYNFCNTYRFYPYKTLVKILAPAKFIKKEEFLAIKNDPKIIHFLGEERPWRIGNKHTYTNEYLKYLNKTPWKNMEMEDGWETYFRLFYIFNFIIKPFPMLRYKIMNILIPIMIKHRKKS